MKTDKDINTELILQIKKNNNQLAFNKLIKLNKDYIYCRFYNLTQDCHLSDELTQIVIIKIYKNIKQINNNNAFNRWLEQIINNSFYDYLRTKDNNICNIIDNEESPYEPSYEQKFYDKIEEDEQLIELMYNAFTKHLPNKWFKIAVLRFFHDFPHEQTAEIMNMPLGTVKSTVHRIKLKMQKLIKEND